MIKKWLLMVITSSIKKMIVSNFQISLKNCKLKIRFILLNETVKLYFDGFLVINTCLPKNFYHLDLYCILDVFLSYLSKISRVSKTLKIKKEKKIDLIKEWLMNF